MNLKLISCLLASCFLSSLMGTIAQAQAEPPIRFFCADGVDPKNQKIYPTTYAMTERGQIPVIRWRYSWFGDNEIVSKGRCQTASSTFQAAYNSGNLNYITNARSAGQPVVCSTDRFSTTCITVLFNLRSSDDAVEALSQVQNVLQGRNVKPALPRYTPLEQFYYSIDMNRFFAKAPVEQK